MVWSYAGYGATVERSSTRNTSTSSNRSVRTGSDNNDESQPQATTSPGTMPGSPGRAMNTIQIYRGDGNMRAQLRPALVSLGLFTLLTGLLYPLVVTGIAQVVFPWQANGRRPGRSEEHTSELQSLAYLVCRLLLEKKKQITVKGGAVSVEGHRLEARPNACVGHRRRGLRGPAHRVRALPLGVCRPGRRAAFCEILA